MKAGVYIHIPICKSKCHYCSFRSQTMTPELTARYCRSLIREIESFSAARLRGCPVDSLYLGGGTPSILSSPQLTDILSACRNFLPIQPDCEVTIECNPGTLSQEKLEAYANGGINRISLGAQSFHDPELAALGRSHGRQDILQTVRQIRAQGIRNLNLDLIMGLPGQQKTAWLENLQAAVTLDVQHLSVYMLELEPEVPLCKSLSRGSSPLPPDDAVANWYLETVDRLGGRGYRQYEISNFCRPGMECRHNLKYWQRVPVYGFGLGSHSFDGRSRYANLSDLEFYLEAVDSGRPTIEWRNDLKPSRELEETLFLGLRLSGGIDWSEIRRHFDADLVLACEAAIGGLLETEWLISEGTRLKLTPRGMLLSNEIFQRFIGVSAGGEDD